MNSCNFVGRLVRDPESKSPTVAKFTIAVDGYDSATKTKKADFIPCVAFGRTAEVVMSYAKKGRQVAVGGRLHKNEWTKADGSPGSFWEIAVNDFTLLSDGSARAADRDDEPLF